MTTQTTPPERQFDFWLGEWDVSWGEGQEGTNRVDKILDGKVIREQFDGNPAMPFQGVSLSVYDARAELWRQTWVDTESNYWSFVGRFEDGRMTLATEVEVEGKPVQLRMVFYNIAADELDWNWERSEDGGKSWELRWHIHYRRKAGR
ncbi:MAG: DUF1579 family protein [Chloroflexota bacterium]|nr:MAG: DUF1579 family protein [Chloroflexota bacterium]